MLAVTLTNAGPFHQRLESYEEIEDDSNESTELLTYQPSFHGRLHKLIKLLIEAQRIGIGALG